MVRTSGVFCSGTSNFIPGLVTYALAAEAYDRCGYGRLERSVHWLLGVSLCHLAH